MRKIASLLLCFLLLSLFSVTAFAADTEQSEDVVIRVTVPNDHIITVAADGATVSVDGKSGDSFTVDRQSTPKLLIEADSGRAIKSVMLGDTNVTDHLQDGYLTLEPVYMDLTLTVTTVTAAETTSPQTGDNTNLGLWIVLLIISGCGTVATTAYDRKTKPMKKS